jgi:hypothetical protein
MLQVDFLLMLRDDPRRRRTLRHDGQGHGLRVTRDEDQIWPWRMTMHAAIHQKEVVASTRPGHRGCPNPGFITARNLLRLPIGILFVIFILWYFRHASEVGGGPNTSWLRTQRRASTSSTASRSHSWSHPSSASYWPPQR